LAEKIVDGQLSFAQEASTTSSPSFNSQDTLLHTMHPFCSFDSLARSVLMVTALRGVLGTFPSLFLSHIRFLTDTPR
jgi:hypothetical protein